MDSQLEIVNKLYREGCAYTFANFCMERVDYEGQFGGADTPEWATFKIRVKNIVSTLVAHDSPAMKLVQDGISTVTEGEYPQNFNTAKSNLIKALTIVAVTLNNDVYGELKKTRSEAKSPLLSNKVFVVHGHDHSLKTEVESFLHEVGLEPIVLHRIPDEGQTIIEKFEKHSDVGYAFILLTPDEISFTVDQVNTKDAQRNKEYRARQNVIFEFGYFVGKLGRSRVCCLHKGEVAVPSDLAGLVYKQVKDSIESQSYSIIKELIAAGYKIKL